MKNILKIIIVFFTLNISAQKPTEVRVPTRTSEISQLPNGNVQTARVTHPRNRVLGQQRRTRMIPTTQSTNRNASVAGDLGPDPRQIANLSTVLGHSQYGMFNNVFKLNSDIYKDKNPNSNTYYYLPGEYSIKWDREANKYKFGILYQAAENSTRGNVLINVKLTSNINSEDIDLAEAFLTLKLGKNINLLPISHRENPEFDFGAILSNFGVEPESISAGIPTDFKQPISIDWNMVGSNVDNFVSAMLSGDFGMYLNFKPAGDTSLVKPVKVNLKVNSSKTYGKIKFDGLTPLMEGWNNNLDYPITVKKLILLRKNGRQQTFETVTLDNQKVASESIYKFDNSTAPNKITQPNDVIKVWLDYDVDDDCIECNQTVKRKLIGGTSGSEITTMEIQVLNALENSGANTIKIHLKSKQADPSGNDEIQLQPIQVTEDGQTISDIEFFVPQGKEISYDYQVLMVMNSGKVLTSKWTKGNSNLLVLGEQQIKNLFPDKKKDEMIDNAKNSAIEKIKDTLLGKDATEKDVIDKAFGILGNLLKKKDSTKTKKKDI